MNHDRRDVYTLNDLSEAVRDGVRNIKLVTSLEGAPSLRLEPGQTISGDGAEVTTLQFARGQDGLQLTTDNEVVALNIMCDPKKRVVYNDTGVEALGRLVLRNLSATGVVQLLAENKVRSGHIEVHDVDVVAADARAFTERPKGYGVEVIQGALTIWNRQSDKAVTITADITGVTAGRAGAPVRGSGIFVAGAGDEGGRLVAHRLETGEVHSDGGIPAGTPGQITGGVFTVSGAHVDTVRTMGPITTYGPNDMVLDNWGTVDHWTSEAKVTSYGPSGIGFVNFGTVNLLEVESTIETFGQGARGFNVYAGTVHAAVFDRIVTHADGAVGIQLSQPVGRIAVRRGIETYGGVGDSLVKGVVMKLAATAFSVKPGGSARQVMIAGGLKTHGVGVAPLELHGALESFIVDGGFTAAGGGFEAI